MNIFIFHRDLRLEDNTALIALAKEVKNITLCFIMTDDQTKNNKYFSQRSFKTLIFALQQLQKQVHINFLSGINEWSVIERLLKEGQKIERIFTNGDYSPYALKRQEMMRELANKYNFTYKVFHDGLLFAPGQICKQTGGNYQVFTPFWKALIQKYKEQKVPIKPAPDFIPQVFHHATNFDIHDFISESFGLPMTQQAVFEAIQQLDDDYAWKRDMLNESTSLISCALKFGVVSIRQVHTWAIKRFHNFDNPFSRQLAWRDFYYQAVFFATQNGWHFGDNWNEQFNQLQWVNNPELIAKWQRGETGFPIVDAGMQQLNRTGIMHNRVRMICASFLVKNLLVDWRIGEAYFAQQLIDYDPIINQCSWQWVAGTGFDAQPFFRIFNPTLQQQKFDPEQRYIHHQLSSAQLQYPPIIDYKQSVQNAQKAYQQLKKDTF